MKSQRHAARSLALVALALLPGLTACTADAIAPPAPLQEYPAEYSVAWVVEQSWELFHEQYPDAVRPEVTVVEVVPQPEWAATMQRCLTGEGFSGVTVAPDGVLTRESTNMAEEYALATYVCSARYPIDPVFFAPLSEAKIGLVYDFYVTSLSACLAAEGFATQPAPLTRDEFIAGWEGVPPWSPYDEVAIGRLGTAEFSRVLAACPQLPADDILHANE